MKIEYWCMYCSFHTDKLEKFNTICCRNSPTRHHIPCGQGHNPNERCVCRFCGYVAGNHIGLVNNRCKQNPNGTKCVVLC